MASLCLVLRPEPAAASPSPEPAAASASPEPAAASASPEPAASPSERPLPEFTIGDLVAQDWIDEFDKEAVDFGEVLGVRYLPESYCVYPADSWLYYIRWTRTTCGLDYLYPCYDGEPTMESELRLVNHG